VHYFQNLETKNAPLGGGTVQFDTSVIPQQTRVRSLQFNFDLTGTKANADTLTADQFAKFVQTVKLGNMVSISGMDLQKLMWQVDGHVVEDGNIGNSIGAGAGTFAMKFNLFLPFRDVRQPASDDGSLPSELCRGLELSIANPDVWGVGSLKVTAGTIRCLVERIHETNVPQLARIGTLDPNTQNIKLDSGCYKDIILVKQDGSNITAADIGVVDVLVDGQYLMQQMRFDQIVTNWNRTCCRNSAPSVTAGGIPPRAELQQSGVPFLPIVWHDNSGKSNISKQPYAESSLVINITSGSLTNARIVFWKAVEKDKESLKTIAATIGAPATATTYEPATASKTPTHAADPGAPMSKKVKLLYGFLPGKWRERATPGNKLAGT